MIIIYVNGFYNPNVPFGQKPHVYQFIKHTKLLGHEVWTYSPDSHPDANRVPSNRFQRLRKLRQANIIYVRVQAEVPKFAHWAIPPYRWLLKRNTPVIWEFNTAPELLLLNEGSKSKYEITLRKFKEYSKGVDLAICVSQSLKDFIKNDLGFKNVVVIPNGSDPDLFRPDIIPIRRVPHTSDCLNAMWMGSAHIKWHNLDLLQQAAEKLWGLDKGKTIQFHILANSGNNLMRNMPPNVNFYGSEDYFNVPKWLAAMDVGLVLYKSRPAHYGSPLKLFDFMSSSLAVVATPIPQICEIFQELDQNELLIEPDNPDHLVSVLLRLNKDRAMLKDYGRRARDLIVTKYNWHRAVSDTFEIINDLCKSK